MTDVICISSSEDEEDSSKKQPSVSCLKRKSSTNLDDEISSKKIKVDDKNNISSDSSKPNKNLPNTDVISPKRHSNEHSVNKCLSPKPGTSIQHDTEHQFQRSQSDSSSTSHKSSPMKKVIKPQLVVRDKIPIPEPSENVFIKFLEGCERKNTSEETKKILNNLKKRYDKLNAVDKDDEEFQMFIKITLQKVSNDCNDKFYTYIQEVKDELKRRTSRLKLSTSSEKESNTSAEQQTIEETENAQNFKISAEDMKKVKKLEKAIKICLKRIKELEEKEVDFDAEENSAYIQEDKYKRKLVELCNALSVIVGDRMLKKEIYKKQIRRKDICGEMTGISSVDEAIISFINSNIKQVNKLKHIKNPNAVADYLLVPDYPDILDCIGKCNKEKNLELTKKKMEQLAKTAFKSIGSYLKKQRVLESEEYISSFIGVADEADPAAKDPELQKRLQNNKKEGDQKLEEIFKKYVDKQEGLSVEDLENLNKQGSAPEDESDDETSKGSEKNNSKSSIKTKLVIESDNESDKNDESKKNKNNAEEKLEINNKVAEDCGDNSKSEESNKNHEIEQVISKKDCTNEIDIFEHKVVLSEEQDSTDKILEKNIKNTNSSLSEITKSCDLSTSTIDVQELSSPSEDSKKDITPVVIEDDDDIQILSDDNEENTESKSNNKSVIENKEKLTILRNTDHSPVEDTTSIYKKEETNCTVVDISKDNNDNIHATLEVCNIKSNNSISIATSFLDKNNKPEGDSKTKSNKVILESILPSELPRNKLEIVEISDVEVLPNGDESSINKAEGSENTEDRNSSSFIKVCSFAKPPESWKDSSSPQKAKKNMHQLPIQQALQDLSNPQCHALIREKEKKLGPTATRCINPLATSRINALSKNVLSVKNTNNHNGSSQVSVVKMPKIDSQKNVNAIRYTTSNPNITIGTISPNSHRIVNNQRVGPHSGNETRN